MSYYGYLMLFCRISILLVFTWSFLGKFSKVHFFKETISHFKLIPDSLNLFAVYLFLTGELTVVLLLLLGGAGLVFGFALACFILTIFSIALASVLIRGIQTSCNCFGNSKKLVSSYDLWRNGGFILCALIGLVSLSNDTALPLSFSEISLITAIAIPFVLVWVNLGEFAQIFSS